MPCMKEQADESGLPVQLDGARLFSASFLLETTKSDLHNQRSEHHLLTSAGQMMQIALELPCCA